MAGTKPHQPTRRFPCTVRQRWLAECLDHGGLLLGHCVQETQVAAKGDILHNHFLESKNRTLLVSDSCYDCHATLKLRIGDRVLHFILTARSSLLESPDEGIGQRVFFLTVDP